MDIVVVGSIAFDDVVTEKKAVRNALGGSAMYFAAAASLFAPV
ncbi:MAG: sugar kinase, partial [Candidatus Latescibacteria bacterium]|nr:sugar kinase [Candidatus Latescibacterota bacterium]